MNYHMFSACKLLHNAQWRNIRGGGLILTLSRLVNTYHIFTILKTWNKLREKALLSVFTKIRYVNTWLGVRKIWDTSNAVIWGKLILKERSSKTGEKGLIKPSIGLYHDMEMLKACIASTGNLAHCGGWPWCLSCLKYRRSRAKWSMYRGAENVTLPNFCAPRSSPKNRACRTSKCSSKQDRVVAWEIFRSVTNCAGTSARVFAQRWKSRPALQLPVENEYSSNLLILHKNDPPKVTCK